jgi:hypothetical protein
VWYLFQGCVTGSVCTYIMSTGECLGDLQYIRIWHDNSGEGNDCSWYLHKIVVRDLQTEEWYVSISVYYWYTIHYLLYWTNVVFEYRLNEVYSIQYYVIKFHSVRSMIFSVYSGFHHKKTDCTIKLKYCWKWR